MDYETIQPPKLREVLNSGEVRRLFAQMIRWLHASYVCYAFGRYTGRRGVVERDDVIQETLSSLVANDYARLRAWSGRGSLRSYVQGFAFNVRRQLVRRPPPTLPEDPLSGAGPPGVGVDSYTRCRDLEDSVVRADLLQWNLSRLLHACTRTEADVLIRRIHGEEIEEIACALGKKRPDIDRILNKIREKNAKLHEHGSEGNDPESEGHRHERTPTPRRPHRGVPRSRPQADPSTLAPSP